MQLGSVFQLLVGEAEAPIVCSMKTSLHCEHQAIGVSQLLVFFFCNRQKQKY